MSKRQKIMEAAAKLFAEKTFESVGIREIARNAGVNSAMISYYFGGKLGLLREIFSTFSAKLDEHLSDVMNEASTQEELLDLTVRRMLLFAREDRYLLLVGLREMNKESDELQDLRQEMYEQGWRRFSRHIDRLGIHAVKDDISCGISFSAMLGTIYSYILMGGVTFIHDDDSRAEYASVVSGILKGGLPSIWRQQRQLA